MRCSFGFHNKMELFDQVTKDQLLKAESTRGVRIVTLIS
jgi:hypothetical protein